MKYLKFGVMLVAGLLALCSLLPLISIALNGSGETTMGDIVGTIQLFLVCAPIYAFGFYAGWHREIEK